MEFRDIHIYDAYITATEDSKLSAISRTFVIINEHISGDIDTGNIETNIHDAHKNTSGDIITLVSNFHISNGQKQLLASKFQNIVLQYISRDELINLFDKYDGDFWKHDDVALLNYEHKFVQNLDKENQLKLLHLPTDKYKKLLSIFIQPSLIKNEEAPITPLTLSLISILYDENDYEVPATITDVYKNFNDLIIGRDIVSTKIEFVDISFRERILSIYAYELMQRENHKPMSREEFIEFFSKFYEGKSLPIKNADLKDVLEYLLHNTGKRFFLKYPLTAW